MCRPVKLVGEDYSQVLVLPKLTGGASGQGVLRGTFGPGPLVEGKERKKRKKKKRKKRKKKKKKGNMGMTVFPPRKFWFLILFSFCLLTVTLYSHFKTKHTRTKKKVSLSFFSYPSIHLSY